MVTESSSRMSSSLAPDMESLIKDVEEVYRECTAYQLSALTHQPNTPWDITRRKSGVGSEIPNRLIEEHYKSKLH